jgi:hypothetical protein
MKFRMERWQSALAVALLLGAGSLPAFAEQPSSVWPSDIYSTDANSAASENPDDEEGGAPGQTVDLANPDIDWSQLDTAAAGSAGLADPKSRRALQDGTAS